ncbi:nitroreductase family protein [bacterium]|nr:nitroreductase family protein [bacterium]
MDALEALLTRRSIRKYRDEEVTENDVDLLLQAAMAAPSAMNEQPWHFVVIRDRSVIEAIHEKHPSAEMLLQAKVVIAVCGDVTKENHPGYWVVDCSIATTHILLAAHARKLGAVWLGIYPREERMELVRDALKLPKNIQPLSLVAIGHPAEIKEPPEREQPDRIHRDSW